MAVPHGPEPAILFVGVLAAGMAELSLALGALDSRFGSSFIASRAAAFGGTKYYAEELGVTPYRVFLAFPGNFFQGRLASIKLATNQLEVDLSRKIAGPWSRPVNLDPGFITLSRIVLASAKDFAHRIFLSDGIFAEVTLQYRGGKFHSLPWTFPDYAAPTYHPFFLSLRAGIASLY